MQVAKLMFFTLPGKGRIHMRNGRFKLAGMAGQMEVADTGPVGLSNTPEGGRLSGDVLNTADNNVTDFIGLRELSVTVQDDAGHTWVCRGCGVTELPELSDGVISLVMEFTSQESVG